MCCMPDLGPTGVKQLTSEGEQALVNLFTVTYIQRFTLRYTAVLAAAANATAS